MTKRKRLSVDGKDDPSKTSIDVSTKKSNVHGSGKKKAGLTESNKKQKQESHFDITDSEHETAVRLLREVEWGKCQNTSRRNVIRLDDPKTPRNSMGKQFCHSFIFGKNMKDSTGQLSYWSTEYPELYAFFQSIMEKVHPEHSYTNITVNKNLVCKKHTDGGNTGNSYIIAFGNFTGGRLIIEKKGGGDPKPIDIFRRFTKFNGSQQPHETEAYQGERYSAVFYTSNITPTETAPRQRPVITNTTTTSSNEQEHSTGTVDTTSSRDSGNAGKVQGSTAMQQKFQAMKKKLQGKARL